jgi:hypothetical protein
LSIRNPKIAEDVTKEVGNVQYNIDKAIETLADANVSKGVSHQQFATSAANKLADMLAATLNSMQMSMSGSGKGKPKQGKGGDMQLPDIIKKQEGLGEKAKKGMKPGQKPGSSSGGKEGQSSDSKAGQGKEGSGKQGANGQSNGGSSQGNKQGDDGEGNAQQIMEIYKEQQQLREALQNELNKQGIGGQGQNAIEQMKQIEKQLLNKGFTNDFLQRILSLKYELLKLEKAIQTQGEDKKRQSETNTKTYQNNTNALPKRLQDYLKSIEILNRQTLPLQPIFEKKVQEYFK